MNKTKIEWCDRSWNPVTGCLHDCRYCYARSITRRFKYNNGDRTLHILNERFRSEFKAEPYPWDFDPTFHRYLLDQPAKLKTPSVIFVGDMCDLFGEWVPDSWIDDVFAACKAAPQHTYLFLTKNPARYAEYSRCWALPDEANFWYGYTVTDILHHRYHNKIDSENIFISIEPIHGALNLNAMNQTFKWAILGAESGNSKNKVTPKLEWIEFMVYTCKRRGIPVFMKNNLANVWGKPLIQQFPEGIQLNEEKSPPTGGSKHP